MFLLVENPDETWALHQITDEPFDHSMPVLSHDGRQVVYVQPVPGVRGFYGDRCLVQRAVNSREQTTIVQLGGPCYYPTWNRTGDRLAWLGHDGHMGCTEATDIGVWVIGKDDDTPVQLCPGFGRSAEDVIVDDTSYVPFGARPIAWTEDQTILVQASDGGRTSIWRFDAGRSGDRPQRPTPVVAGNRRILAFDYARGRILAAYSSPADPCRVLVSSPAGERTIYTPNAEWLSARTLSTPEPITFSGAEGATIEGWLIPPLGRDIEGAPCVLQVNRGRFGWSFYLESQALAAAGFAVAFINPHGSYGYGEVFRNSTHYNPGTTEVDDVVRALDFLESKGIDRTRIGVSGTSFGGFLVNWLVTQYPERFAAAVSQNSYCNRHSLWGTSSIGPTRWDKPGPPWEHAEFLLSRSPLTYVDRVRIPMLLIQGDLDTICTFDQAEQWYTALAMRGLNPTWLILRGEAHDLARTARPESRLIRMRSIVGWFRSALLGEGDTSHRLVWDVQRSST